MRLCVSQLGGEVAEDGWRMAMNSLARAWTINFVIAFSFANASTIVDAAEDLGPSEHYLSLRHSLIPMFGRLVVSPQNFFHEEHFPMNRLDPRARVYARAALGEERIGLQFDLTRQRGAIWLLGFVGDQSDVDLVGKFVDKRNQLNPKDRTSPSEDILLAGDVGFFTGAFIARSAKGSEDLVGRYAKLAAWSGGDDLMSAEGLRRAKERWGNFMSAAYSYSRADELWSIIIKGDPDTGQKPLPANRVAMLESIKNGRYKIIMAERRAPPAELDQILGQCMKAWGKEIDQFIAEVDGKPNTSTTQPVVSSVDSLTRGAVQSERDSIGKVIAEALDAYESARAEISKGNPDLRIISSRLADDGNAIDDKRIQGSRAEFNRELTRLSEFLSLLEKQRCVYGPAAVSTAVRELFVETERGSGNYTIQREEERTVAIPIMGSEEMAKTIRSSPRMLPTVQDGRLVIYMIKRDDRWLWNPFGW